MGQTQKTPFITEKWIWLTEIAIGLFIVIVLSFALGRIVRIFRDRAGKKEGFWRLKAHKIMHVPLQVAVWGFGLAYIVDVIATHFGFDAVTKYVRPLKLAFIVACFGWIALRGVKEAFRHLARRSEKLGVSPGTIYALSKLTSFVVTILILLSIFPIFGFSVAPLLAFGGIGVAGMAFAAQDMIGNFFGGAMLHFTRVFSVNDMVTIPDKANFRGIVQEIGWYITVMRDYDRRPVYFPNALFSKTHVINESRRSHRRIFETIAIRYEDEDKLEIIIEELKEKISQHPDVDDKDIFSISFSKFAASGLEILIYVLIPRVGYVKFLEIQQEILLIIKEVVLGHGAQFCYPTTTVHFADKAPEFIGDME